jgi:hypothetical protein
MPTVHSKTPCRISSARARPKRKRTGPQSPHQPTKQMRDTSPTHTLMHSKHAGPSTRVMTEPIQLPPTTPNPARLDSVETEEGWKKVERRKGKGKREKKVGNRSAGGVPTWADIARGRGVSVNVFIGAGATPSRRHAGRQETGRRSSKGIRDPLLLLRWQDERKEGGEGEPWGCLERWLRPRGLDSDFLCPA